MTTATHPVESWTSERRPAPPASGFRTAIRTPGRSKWPDGGLLYSIATFFALFAALPFAWMIFTVFKQNSDLYNGKNNPFLYNDPPTLDNVRVPLRPDEVHHLRAATPFFVAVLVDDHHAPRSRCRPPTA